MLFDLTIHWTIALINLCQAQLDDDAVCAISRCRSRLSANLDNISTSKAFMHVHFALFKVLAFILSTIGNNECSHSIKQFESAIKHAAFVVRSVGLRTLTTPEVL